LYTDELERLGSSALFFETERDHFLNAFHEDIEGSRLRVATMQGGHRGHIVSLRVSLDDNIKFRSHGYILQCLDPRLTMGVQRTRPALARVPVRLKRFVRAVVLH